MKINGGYVILDITNIGDISDVQIDQEFEMPKGSYKRIYNKKNKPILITYIKNGNICSAFIFIDFVDTQTITFYQSVSRMAMDLTNEDILIFS